MATRTYKFETKIGRSASTARKCTEKYTGERSRGAKNMLAYSWGAVRKEAKPMHGTELISRFGAKSLYGKGQLCWAFQKGGL